MVASCHRQISERDPNVEENCNDSRSRDRIARALVCLRSPLRSSRLAAITNPRRQRTVTPYTPPPAAPTVTLSANPTSINQGDSSTLTWSSTNATQLTIAPDVGPVNAEGNSKVTPSDSITYTITATGPGGSANASARVTVSTPAPPTDTGTSSNMTDALFNREIRDAFFDLDKADIRADAREALSHDAEFLRNYPSLHVTIEGHCDERGSTEYNLGLGDRRACAVKQYLVSLGIAADRLSTVSFGKEKPFCMRVHRRLLAEEPPRPLRKSQLKIAGVPRPGYFCLANKNRPGRFATAKVRANSALLPNLVSPRFVGARHARSPLRLAAQTSNPGTTDPEENPPAKNRAPETRIQTPRNTAPAPYSPPAAP